jgi:ADP-dependent NAD(P)H-hydrate dehydratase
MHVEDITNTPLPQLPPRPPDSHKGDFGRALLVGGSRGMSGAITLAGLAALRGGAGLVTLAVPRIIQDIVAGFNPSYMTHTLSDDGQRIDRRAAKDVTALAESATAVALGPGLGRSAALTEFVAALYTAITRPMVVDADALVALSSRPEILAQPGGPRVLTPHPGEFARLASRTLADAKKLAVSDDGERMRAASTLAQHDATGKTVVVLKGHRTVIADANRSALNTTGNPGMATGGSGDVLTGVITALLCQGLEPFDAARLGVHVHGLAGDLAAQKLGQVSLIANDLIDFLPSAFLAAASPSLNPEP